jgi:hypothetical protein
VLARRHDVMPANQYTNKAVRRSAGIYLLPDSQAGVLQLVLPPARQQRVEQRADHRDIVRVIHIGDPYVRLNDPVLARVGSVHTLYLSLL